MNDQEETGVTYVDESMPMIDIFDWHAFSFLVLIAFEYLDCDHLLAVDPNEESWWG